MAATFSKPATTPRWADDGTPLQIVVPPSGKQDLGWVFEEEPPFSYFNWHQNLTGEWMKWIGERLDDGVDENTLIIRNPDNASAFIELDGPNETIDFDGTSSPLTLDLSGTAPFFSSGILGFGDENFQIDFNSGNPQIVLDAGGDALTYTRAANLLAFDVAGTSEFTVRPTGANVLNGLVVGDTTTAPTNDDVQVLGGITAGFAGDPAQHQVLVGDVDFGLDFVITNVPRLFFDGTADSIQYLRTTDQMEFVIGSSTRLRVAVVGVNVSVGLHVGDIGVTPIADGVSMGVDSNFRLSGTTANLPTLQFDTNDLLRYTRSGSEYQFLIGNVSHTTINSTTLAQTGASDGAALIRCEVIGASHGAAQTSVKTQTGGEWVMFMDDTVLSVGMNAVADLGFFRSGTGIAMAIEGSTANVGIGTTNPITRLHVSEPASGIFAAIIENTGGTSTSAGLEIKAGVAAGNANTFLQFRDGDDDVNGRLIDNGAGQIQLANGASDPRLKDNIAPTQVKGLDVINGIELIEFNWNYKKAKPFVDIGFNADNCEKVYPRMVGLDRPIHDDDTEYKYVTPASLLPVLIKAVQELSAQVEALQP